MLTSPSHTFTGVICLPSLKRLKIYTNQRPLNWPYLLLALLTAPFRPQPRAAPQNSHAPTLLTSPVLGTLGRERREMRTLRVWCQESGVAVQTDAWGFGDWFRSSLGLTVKCKAGANNLCRPFRFCFVEVLWPREKYREENSAGPVSPLHHRTCGARLRESLVGCPLRLLLQAWPAMQAARSVQGQAGPAECCPRRRRSHGQQPKPTPGTSRGPSAGKNGPAAHLRHEPQRHKAAGPYRNSLASTHRAGLNGARAGVRLSIG